MTLGPTWKHMTAILGPLFTLPVPGSIWTASKCCLTQVGRPLPALRRAGVSSFYVCCLGAVVLVFIPARGSMQVFCLPALYTGREQGSGIGQTRFKTGSPTCTAETLGLSVSIYKTGKNKPHFAGLVEGLVLNFPQDLKLDE